MIPKAKPNLIGSYKDIKELRKKITNWLKLNYSNTGILNDNTDFFIEFNSTSFRKLVSGRIGKTKLLALTAIKDIIKAGQLIYTETDRKNRDEIICIYKFNSKVEVNNKIYDFYFTVRQLKNGKYIYSGHLNIKKYETNRQVL